VLREGRLFALVGGGRLRYPQSVRFVLTSRRFVYWDPGKWAALCCQGVLWQLIVRGRPVSLPLAETRLRRGRYGLNRNLLEMYVTDGRTLLLDRHEKSLAFFREALGTAGMGLVQHSADEWGFTEG
jgi:hypothetical protein